MCVGGGYHGCEGGCLVGGQRGYVWCANLGVACCLSHWLDFGAAEVTVFTNFLLDVFAKFALLGSGYGALRKGTCRLGYIPMIYLFLSYIKPRQGVLQI